MKRTISIVTLGLLLGSIWGFGQNFILPENWAISSDYGPRKVNNGSSFHRAIDWANHLFLVLNMGNR